MEAYLRFKSSDGNFGIQTGHITVENSISNSTSAKATSKYNRAAGNKVENIKHLFRISYNHSKSTYETCNHHE